MAVMMPGRRAGDAEGLLIGAEGHRSRRCNGANAGSGSAVKVKAKTSA
jgi:hypothetical protein